MTEDVDVDQLRSQAEQFLKEHKFMKAEKVANQIINHAKTVGDETLQESMVMFNVEVENQKNKMIHEFIAEKKIQAENLYKKLKLDDAIDSAREVIDFAADAGLPELKEEMTMFIVQVETVKAKMEREIEEKRQEAERLYGMLKYRDAIVIAREIIDYAIKMDYQDLQEAMTYFIIEVENKMAKVEREVIADKKEKVEALFEAEKFEEAIDLAREIINFAENAGEPEVAEAFTYFIVEAETQIKKLGREILVPASRTPVLDCTKTQVHSSSANGVSKSEVETLIVEANIRAEYRWISNRSPYILTHLFPDKDAAIDYCIELEDNGKITWIDFKMVKVVRSAYSGQVPFNDHGVTWCVYERS